MSSVQRRDRSSASMHYGCTVDGCTVGYPKYCPALSAARLVPAPWPLSDARDTVTAIAAYADADERCTRFGPRFFACDADYRTFLASPAARASARVWRFDLDRETGRWSLTETTTR